MPLVLYIILASGLLDVFLNFSLFWKARRYLGVLLLSIVTISTLMLLILYFNKPFAYVVVFVSVYRVFNLYRGIHSKIQIEHLRRISLNSSFRLWLAQIFIAFIWLCFISVKVLTNAGWEILASLNLLVGLVVYVSVLRNKKVTHKISLNTNLEDSKVPTLTVAIPARNETDTLNECLESLISSDYPKLEILVLDDQSTNRRTPEIIRSFAHDGVEFIPGRAFNYEWLAKNWAYQQLLDVANGDVILFCGADTRFDRESLRFLVSVLENRNKQIISILPKNVMPGSIMQRILQPLRYCWEIALPRRVFNRPPILSTCWVVRRDFLTKNGGFKAVSRRVSPESYFAKLALAEDGYSFFQYHNVVSNKLPSDQYETALRLRYPQSHRQPETIALITLSETLAVLVSFVLLLASLINGNWIVAVLSFVAIILFSLCFGTVSNITYAKNSLSSYFIWPLALFMDLWLLHLSMWRYEFGTVLWKGRSIAPSVMSHDTSGEDPLLYRAH